MPGAAERAARPQLPQDVVLTTEVSEAAWDRFVSVRQDASGYHVWRWRRVFERAFGHQTVYLAACERQQVVGILPLVLFQSRLFGRFAVSLPFVNYGGVCARDNAITERLVDWATSFARERRLSHVELRHVARRLPHLPARQHKVAMRLPLNGGDARHTWDALDRKVRNQIRKAEKSGLTCRSGGAELLGRFYAVFARNMRDLGTPVYSSRLFTEVLAAFSDTARVFLVDHADRTVAGGIALRHRDVLEVPWASSLREYRSQCPNNLLYWRIIEHAIESGCATLDFGRSTPYEGTYQFKEQWGARPEPLAWEYVLHARRDLPNLSPSNPRYRAAISVWTRLPLAAANLIGPYIVRSIP